MSSLTAFVDVVAGVSWPTAAPAQLQQARSGASIRSTHPLLITHPDASCSHPSSFGAQGSDTIADTVVLRRRRHRGTGPVSDATGASTTIARRWLPAA